MALPELEVVPASGAGDGLGEGPPPPPPPPPPHGGMLIVSPGWTAVSPEALCR